MNKLIVFLFIVFSMQSCDNKTHKANSTQTENNSNIQELPEANTIPSEFKSPLRLNEKLK